MKELLEKIAKDEDVAAAAIGYALGYGLALQGLIPSGGEPATVAAVCAVGLFGLKKIFDPIFNFKQRRKRRIRRKAAALRLLLDEIKWERQDDKTRLEQALVPRFRLWQGGMLSNELFEEELDRIRAECDKKTRPLEATAVAAAATAPTTGQFRASGDTPVVGLGGIAVPIPQAARPARRRVRLEAEDSEDKP